MADSSNIDKSNDGDTLDDVDPNIAISSSDVRSITESVNTNKSQRVSSSSDRQVKFERAQKALENAALVSKRIKEHRKATAELLGRPFEDDDIGESAEMASTLSERTGYSVATDTSTNLSVQDALNIPGISESLANTLKQKELLMERIKQYKEISKRPMKSAALKRDSVTDIKQDIKKNTLSTSSDTTHFLNTIKDKENTLSIMQVKMKAMETTILDLQEKINEKDQIIEAKNMATTLMSDTLSKKEKDSILLLEDTKQQMIKMQENFITMESEWKEEKQMLLKELEKKEDKVKNLEEANTILENSRFEVTLAHSKLVEDIELKNKEISELQKNIQSLSQESIQKEDAVNEEEEKGSKEISMMVELSKKVELLEQINCQIRQTNIELENKLANFNTDVKSVGSNSPSKKASPLPTRKGGRSTASKMKSPWSNISESPQQESEKKANKNELSRLEVLVQSLNKDILEKEYIISQKDGLVSELQSTVAHLETSITELKTHTKTPTAVLDVGTDTVDIGISKEHTMDIPMAKSENLSELETDNLSSVELEEKLKTALQQISLLNGEIDSANKNMIKVKSNNKLKLKQLQKTIDNFSKVSDSNAEIVKLNEELHQLSQKVAELEEEKGNLQLHLVDYDSGRLTESDVYKKMIEMENLAETRLKAISVLEAQKFDLVQDLHSLKQKNVEMEDKLVDMSQMHNEQVCTEIKSVQLEEQIDELTASRKELEIIIENLKLDKEQLNSTIQDLQEEKDQLVQKLESYIQENIELTDKLEKLSVEKVSSAESIEIVESLTTQEKLELEEYNKGMIENKAEPTLETFKDDSRGDDQNVECFIEQIEELNKKIHLFTQEREEVMDKMNTINTENELLHSEMTQITNECEIFKNKIDMLNNEKQELKSLNLEINRQLDELKRERVEILKETAEAVKPLPTEDNTDTVADVHHDDKNNGEKGVSRTKSVKQLTKEILKLKSTIKEREDEIADCQMKILSLEEQHQKQNELIQTNVYYENKLKLLADENQSLKDSMEKLKDKEPNEMNQLRQCNELMKEELHKTRQEYTNVVSARDARVHELENILLEYEKQIFNYSNTLQQKDKEIVEYINQITKLNDVSQKLKSTIELLEEEKAKDPNAELIKSLNKQISSYQKRISDFEDKLKSLEDEKVQLLSIKTTFENKNSTIETELKELQESCIEKQNLIKDLQALQQKHTEEVSNARLQAKERDEEIHEIKLQLRKESIENEKLRTNLSEKDKILEDYTQKIEDFKDNLNILVVEKQQLLEQVAVFETKNKELLEKLKKFAASIKKKSSMYTELEFQFNEAQKHLQTKNDYLEQLSIQVDAMPALQEKLKYAEEEINRLQAQKNSYDQQKSQEFQLLCQDMKVMEQNLLLSSEEGSKLNDALNIAHKELQLLREDNIKLSSHIDVLNKKNVDLEIEQKDNLNLITKISSLELDINQKQTQIGDLLQKLENQEQSLNQLQFGHSAKVQERDLYIESLETEMNKYKSRICRLEESISVMEDRRHSLERKADQLGSELQEKQKAYTDYSSQEDGLVNRLAVLIDHDRVIEKQLHEIEVENRQLQDKIQHLSEENGRLRKSISDVQEHYNNLLDKANRTESAESDLIKYQTQLHDLEIQHKKTTHEHQASLLKKKQDIEDLETEFNTQIENAIKEKKVVSEKYEKLNDHVCQLGMKLQDYVNENEQLKINLQELNRINQELSETNASNEKSALPDYTEQYISEINRLNSVINCRNEEITDFNGRLHTLQTYLLSSLATVSEFENKISELSNKLSQSTHDVDLLVKEIEELKENNNQLQELINNKDEQIKELKEKKTFTFDMSIPKTEGMIISSTIEALNYEEPIKCDVSDLESQILTEIPMETPEKKTTINLEPIDTISTNITSDPTNITEEVIVPKKAYLCYKDEANTSEAADPFNSDEGWGLDGSEEHSDVIPGVTYLNEQIHKLQKENESLKKDLEAMNTKMLKVMKKFKELKTNNDVLVSELKLSKQISQSSFLDSAIEDELRHNIQELEKKIQELSTDIVKEKREKDSIKKQNEVIFNANEKLMEMKEKLENEIELWKYNFKEVNNKLSSFQWSEENKESPVHKVTAHPNKNELTKDTITDLEKENDELQAIIVQLTSQNNELLTQQTNLKCELYNLKQQLHQLNICQNCEKLNHRLIELESKSAEESKTISTLNEKLNLYEIICKELTQNYETLKTEYDEVLNMHEISNNKLSEQFKEQENELLIAKQIENDSHGKLKTLREEIEELQQKLNFYEENSAKTQNQENLMLVEKVATLEQHCFQLKEQLDLSIENSSELKFKYDESESKVKDLEQNIFELNSKILKLNSENDQLLSNVTELQSSISGAVDQRGYEIAEIWKQHLAQRESDFLKTEQDLRAELSAAEFKYEQLLDNVQSSSQEETNKLVVMEQVNALQSKVQDKEEHLRSLQDKYSEAVSQLDMLRSEIEDEKVIYENKLLVQQDEYEKIVNELSNKNKQLIEDYEQSLKTIESNLCTSVTECSELKQQVLDLRKNIEILEASVVDLNHQLRIKESEIYSKSHEFSIALTQRNEEFENIRKSLLEYEKKIEDLNYEKESELALLRLKIHEKADKHGKIESELNAEKASLAEALKEKIVECTNLNKVITDLNKSLEEHASNATEMQTALENQEFEIVTLKDEIFSLQQSIKKSSSKIEKHVTFASDTKSIMNVEEGEGLVNKELLDAVPRAELDLALYMLHQRDVRCEELTMELTQLLEERDTLQLRLSDSLRSNEDMKLRLKTTELDASTDSIDVLPQQQSYGVEKESPFVDTHRGQTSRSSSTSEFDPEKPNLHAKLTELRTVKHSRDVRLRHESEQRQMDLRLLQRDVANLPPEAVDQLAQAHHTLSRDSQSTSTVLLNWLRGKSTPKVVHNM